MSSYKVTVLETFHVTHVVSVGADSIEEANEKALEELEYYDYSLNDFDYIDSNVIKTDKVNTLAQNLQDLRPQKKLRNS